MITRHENSSRVPVVQVPALRGRGGADQSGVMGQAARRVSCPEKLAEKGIATEEMVAEDWGWYVPVRNEGFRLALCCGHQNGDDDEFVCFTDPSTPIVKKFFKKIDATAQLTRLTEALQQILASDPEIRDVVWIESR